MQEDRRDAADGADAPHVAVVGDVAFVDVQGIRHRVRGRQPQLVLAYLALEGRPVDREELADLLWGEEIPTHWAGAVRGVLTKVRAALDDAGLAPECVTAEDGRVRLELPPSWTVDLSLAETAIAEARRHLVEGRTDEALDQARAAESLLRSGPFLTTGDGPWVRRQQERLVALQRQAAAIAVEALCTRGAPGEAAARAAERLAADPFDERLHHLRIEALLADGQPSAAVTAYEDLADLLRRELGIAPAADTAALVAGVQPSAERDAVEPVAGPTPPESIASSGPGARLRAARRPSWLPSDDRFVGRRHEMDQLERARDRVAATGRPEVVVVGGHAGLGKTRLAAELASARRAAGDQVLWGRCRPASGVAFEPVVEALASMIDADPDLGARLGPEGAGLALLLPELRRDGSPALDDSSVARAQMHRSVVAAFEEWSEQPTIWVVDDLQWASADSLMMIEILLAEVARPLLVIATCRGTTPLVDAHLARAQRLVPTQSVGLDGLTADEVRELMAGVAVAPGRTVDEVAVDLHQRSSGHPFLVAQVVDEARRTGRPVDPADLPAAVRDWLSRRVGELPVDVAATLQLASVVGLDVDLDLLDQCSADPLPDVLERCEQLVAAGLLVEEDDEVGRFRFPHVITREVVLAGLGSSRRALLERTVGDAERQLPAAPGRHTSLALRYHRAGPGFLALALEHQIEAGWEALDHASLGLAVELFESAVASAREADDLPDRSERLVRALVGAGQAHHRSGDRDTAECLLMDAVERARAADLPVRLAEAVLSLVGRAGRGAGESLDDAAQAALVREALAGLERAGDDGRVDDERESLILRLEGELALALLLTDAVDERESLVRGAVARVRADPDPAPRNLARALLNARIALLDPDQVGQRLADLDEVLALPVHQLSPEQTIAALTYRHEDLLRLGRRSEADAALGRATLLADHHRHPYWQWAVRTWRGVGRSIDGDLDEAESLARAAADLHADTPEESMACLQVNLVTLRLLDGRPGEVVDLVAASADAFPQIPCYRAVLALCLSEAGDAAGAEVAYRFFADGDFANVPRDTNRFLSLDVLSHVAADLGDRDGGQILASLLEPHRGLHVVLNCYGGGGVYWGPATHALARLTALGGDEASAAGLFAEAEGEADSVGAKLHLQRIRADARTFDSASR